MFSASDSELSSPTWSQAGVTFFPRTRHLTVVTLITVVHSEIIDR